jgi:eukaryotic-like serine/threonine-protein kinase
VNKVATTTGEEQAAESPDTSEALPELPSGTIEASTKALRRRLSSDIDNIVLKALRKEPARRYASVEQFAEDIRRHLDGLPVNATKASWTYRAGKFVRRHKVGVGAAVLVTVAVLGGVGATVREARIAAANARRADRRFNDVRKLANSFLFEFHDAIEHLQGSTPARELVVKRALEYLDSLSQEAGTDATLRLELVNAYEKVGSVQGSPYRDNLGNVQGALQSFQKAAAILEQLVKASPQDQDLRSQLARDYGEIGDILDASGDLNAAMNSYRKGLDVLEAEQHPNMKAKIRAESMYDRYGLGLTESGDLVQAVENFQKSIALLDQLIQEDPSDRDNVRDKAIGNIHLGGCLKRMRRFPEALAANRLAYGLMQSLVVEGNHQSKRDVIVASDGVGEILQKTGDNRGALAIWSKMLAEDRVEKDADPSNALSRRDVYQDYAKVALAQSALGDLKEALANQRQSVGLNESEMTKGAAGGMARKDLEGEYFQLGEILSKAKRESEALGYFEKAKAVAAALSKENPKDVEVRGDLAEIGMDLGAAEFATGKESAALGEYREALAVAEPVAAASPANADWQVLLARLDQKRGEYYGRRAQKDRQGTKGGKDREEALRSYKKSLDLWNRLKAQNALGADYARTPDEVAREIAQCQSTTP